MKYIKSQTGNTLLFAIMVLMLGSVIALTLIGMSINGTARNEHRENYNQAKKNAESGIEHLIASMEKDLESKIPSPGIDTNHNKTASFRNDFMDILSTYSCPPNEEKDYEKYYIHNKDGSTWYATCVQYDEKENKEYKNKIDQLLNKNDFYVPITIKSRGFADGEEKVIIAEAKFGVTYKNYPSILDFAVATHPSTLPKEDPNYKSESLILNGGIQIKGNVYTNGNIAVANRAYAPKIDADEGGNPWKSTIYPEIKGINNEPAQIYMNPDKSLFNLKKWEISSSCKRSEEAKNLINGLKKLMDKLGDTPKSLINLVSVIAFGYYTVPDKYFTYYDLQHYKFDEHTSQNDQCFYKKYSIKDIDSFLTEKSDINIKTAPKELTPVPITGYINHGKTELGKINNSLKNALTEKINAYETKVLYKKNIQGSYKFNNGNIVLLNSSLKGQYYITTEVNNADSVNTSVTVSVLEILDNVAPQLKLGTFLGSLGDDVQQLLKNLLGGVHNLLKGLVDLVSNILKGLFDFLGNLLGIKKDDEIQMDVPGDMVSEEISDKVSDKLDIDENDWNTMDGEFYIKNNIERKKLLIQLLKGIGVISKSDDPDATRLLDFLINNEGLIPKGRALNLDPGLLGNGNFTLKGVYFIDGDVKINNSNIKGDAILFVNGDVNIQHTKLNTANNNKLIIFATGDIIYQFSSQLSTDLKDKYLNETPLVVNAFLYSDKKIELHGTISNIHLKGGVAANQVILSGVRGSFNKYRNKFENKDNANSPSRLIIEHDPAVWETFVELTKKYDNSSMPGYYEFFMEPTTITSRK